MMALFVATLGIVSCSKTDLYDEGAKQAYEQAQEQAQQEAQQEKAADEYKDKFVESFGEIDPNQSWDFSTGDEYFNLPSGARAATRGESAATYKMTKSENYYEIEQSTLDKMGEVFKEGDDNRALGKPFAMTVPGNKFTIMPIFMGQSGGDFDLYMHVDGVGEILVWRKWEDMQAKFEGSNDWKNLFKASTELVWEGFFPKIVTVRESTTGGMNTVEATAIHSKYFTFEGLPEGATMYFYLKITSAASGYNTTGQSLGSVNNFMREYQFGPNDLKPENLPGVDKPEVKIIGCEDASNPNTTDNDFNDVVFMIYGEPYVPQSFEVKDLEKIVKKRYMVEDLDSNDDIDFNDIVVDVVSTYTYTQTTSNSGIVTYGPETLKSRKAEIKALGGTLDFELNLGGKKWKKSDEFDATVMYNTDPIDYNLVLAELELPLTFDPATNNISVTVYQKDSDKVSAEVNFPASGTTPMIIAFNSYVQWSKERVRFPFEDYVNK